jgi:hypothetical protein
MLYSGLDPFIIDQTFDFEHITGWFDKFQILFNLSQGFVTHQVTKWISTFLVITTFKNDSIISRHTLISRCLKPLI